MKIKLGELELDLKAALPLTLGDLRKLKSEYGLSQADLTQNPMEMETVAKFLLAMLRKVDRNVTEAQVDLMPMDQMGGVVTYLLVGAEPDRPT